MTYTRRSYTKKNYRKRAPRNRRLSYTAGAKNAFALAKQAASDIWYLKGLVNSEMQHKDNIFTLGANQSQIFSFVNIAQGNTATDRTGNSILLRNLYIRGRITANPSITNYSRITCALVKDKQQVADTTPAITDIFTSSTDPDAMLQTNTFGRFKVLWRQTYVVTTPNGGQCGRDIHKYWQIRDHVRYNGTANTDVQRNGYYFVVITDEATNFPTVVFNARTGYHDN